MSRSPINLEVLEAMAEAGATAAAIVGKVREMLELRRGQDRVRQQRSRRVRKLVCESSVSESVSELDVTPSHAESRHVTLGHAGVPPPITPLEEKKVSKKETTTATSHALAFEISKRVAALCGYPPLLDDGEHVAAWLAAGFTEQFILAVVKKVMGRRRPPPVVRISYFDGPLADERERQRQCVLPLAGQPAVIVENPNVRRTPKTGWQTRRDEQHAALGELSDLVRTRHRGSGGT
jgi:hypothetical protein